MFDDMGVNARINAIVMQALRKAEWDLLLRAGIKIRFESDPDLVPSTGAAIHRMWVSAKTRGTPFVIYSGANEAANLYFSPSVNLLYRTVHDVDHALWYECNRGTTKYNDERFLNCLMAKRVYDWCVTDDYYTEQDALIAFFCMYHDTVGQVEYYKKHGDFVKNQRALTCALLNECVGYKAAKRGALGVAYQVMQGMLRECAVC